MKRFLIVVFSILGFSVLSEAQEQVPLTDEGLTHESIERRLERNEDRIEHERHGQRPRTWVDRGIIFQDIFDVNIEVLYFGMTEDELMLFKGDPKEKYSTETEMGIRHVLVYDKIEIYFEDGQLVGWKETEVIHENPLDEAYSAFQRASVLLEEEEPGFFQRIFGSRQEGRLEDAYLRLHGQYISQAVLAYEERDFSDAFNSFKTAVEIADSPYYDEPVDTGLIFNTGFVATLAEDYEEAIEYLGRAKDLDYGEGDIYAIMKDAYVGLGDSTNAELILQEGFEKYPQNNVILVELVNFYINAEQSETALEYLELAKEQEPENPSFHFAEGMLHEKLEEPDKAKEAYLRSIDLDPDFFDGNYNMGVMYYNEAVSMLEEANEIVEVAEYEKARDEAFDVMAQAVPYLERAHEINPETPEVMETLRIIYYRLGYEEKLEEMNRKLGREPLE